MERRHLGNSEVKVTPIAFGAWAIGGWMWGGAEEKAAIKALQSAYEHGITTIDTAPVYGFGKSEELIGKAMKEVPRDKYQLLTKYGMNWESEDGEYFFDSEDSRGKLVKIYKWASKERVKKECEDSLKRLRTDYIDLFQIHWPDATTPISETMEAVLELINEGKVRAAGVCNYNTKLVEEATKSIELATNQVPYSLINRKIEKHIIPQAIEKSMSILPYSPLQRGLLTGKIKKGHKFNKGDSREGDRFYSEENIEKANQLLAKIKPIADDYDATFAQLVINWTVQQQGIGCVLVGARDEKQVRDNVKALDFKLTENELNMITRASDEFEFN